MKKKIQLRQFFITLILLSFVIGLCTATPIMPINQKVLSTSFQKSNSIGDRNMLNDVFNQQTGLYLSDPAMKPDKKISGKNNNLSTNVISSFTPSFIIPNMGLKSTFYFSLKQYQSLNQKANTSTSSTYQNLDDYYNAIEAYKNNLSPIQRKIDLVILSLFLDPNYPKYANEDLSMQRAGTVIPALELGPNGGAFGDAVQVYIDLEPGATSDVITPYLYSLMGKSPDSNRYAAIVPLKNIYSLASLDDVLRISLVAPGILAGSR